MGGFTGYVDLGGTYHGVIFTRNSGGAPADADSAPTYRVYGDAGTALASGTASLRDAGTITGATNASPIVITSAAHGLSTGARVTISGVGGNTAANGTFVVTVLTANTFSLDGSTGNGTYTSGGTWHISGLYGYDVAVTGGAGFDRGQTFKVIGTAVIGGAAACGEDTFGVV